MNQTGTKSAFYKFIYLYEQVDLDHSAIRSTPETQVNLSQALSWPPSFLILIHISVLQSSCIQYTSTTSITRLFTGLGAGTLCRAAFQ